MATPCWRWGLSTADGTRRLSSRPGGPLPTVGQNRTSWHPGRDSPRLRPRFATAVARRGRAPSSPRPFWRAPRPFSWRPILNEVPWSVLQALRLSATWPLDGSFDPGPQGGPCHSLSRTASRLLPLQEVDRPGAGNEPGSPVSVERSNLSPLRPPRDLPPEVAEDSLFREVSDHGFGGGDLCPKAPGALAAPDPALLEGGGPFDPGRPTEHSLPRAPGGPSWVTLDVLNDPGGSQVTDPQPELQVDGPGSSRARGPLHLRAPGHSRIGKGKSSRVIQVSRRARFELPEATPLQRPSPVEGDCHKPVTGAADTVTSAGPFVVTGAEKPPVTILYQNFPNPFPDTEDGVRETRIWFDLADPSPVELALFDLARQARAAPDPRTGVRTGGTPSRPIWTGWWSRSRIPARNFTWDGRDDSGREAPPGVYLLRLRAGRVVDVRRVVYWP